MNRRAYGTSSRPRKQRVMRTGSEAQGKAVTRKITRATRAAALAVGAVVISAVVLGGATTALAAVPGDPLKLGRINAIDRATKLVGKAKSPRLVIQNGGPGVALRLLVEPGNPPMQVNSTARIPNLNADRVDGRHAAAFLPRNGKAADADRLDGEDASQFHRYGQTIPPGATATGAFGGRQQDRGEDVDYVEVVSLPLPAPRPLADEDVNFAERENNIALGDGDPACTGTIREPTAPPGKVCLYASVLSASEDSLRGEALTFFAGNRHGFRVVGAAGGRPGVVSILGTWAYTAP